MQKNQISMTAEEWYGQLEQGSFLDDVNMNSANVC